MNKPLPRSSYGKKFSENYDRIFRQGLGVKEPQDLVPPEDPSKKTSMFVISHNKYFVWNPEIKQWSEVEDES